MGFLSGLFSDKKKTESTSNQSGMQSYGLSPEVKKYWESIGGSFDDWKPVESDPYQKAAAQAQAGYASGLNPAFAGAVGIGQTGIDPNSIARFQNPYEDQVVKNTLDDMRYADSKALTQSNAAAAKMGALGGSGGIVRRNLAEEGFQDARNKAITGIRQQGFNTAADLAGKSVQAQLAGYGAASGIAGQQGNLTGQSFNQGTQFYNQAFQNAMMPYQLRQQGAGILGSLAGVSGQQTAGNSSGTQTTTGSPSIFSIGANLFGGALAGGWKPFARDGGRIEGKADGGAVEGARGENDPHAKFKSAFEAITGLIQKSRGGSVSGMEPPSFAAGGPAIGPWTTTVTPASSSFDMKKFGQGLQKMGQGQEEGHETSMLQSQQQTLSGMLSGMTRRARGGEVEEDWGESGPRFGGSSGLVPPMGLGAGPDRVERRALPAPRASSSYPDSDDALLTAIKGFEGYNPRAYGDYKQHSVGYGTRARHPGEVIDKAEADRRLAAEVAAARGIVDKFAPNLDPGTRAALTSLTYNAGDDWTRAGLGEAIRSGNMDEARRRFTQYNKAGGETLSGLVNRRQAEVAWMGGAGPSGEPIRVAEAQPTSASATVATDAPKRGGWFSEGIWSGEKMTPLQRLGVGLMSVRGPMFGGPLNDMAKQLMAMEEGRLAEKRIDNQADQFAKQIAQQAAIAAGEVDGKQTIQARQLDEQKRVHDAEIENKKALAAQLKLQTPEYRATVAEKFGLKPGTGDYQAFVLNGTLPARAASGDQYKEIGGKLVRIPAGGGKPEVVFDGGPDFSKLPEFAMKSAAFASRMTDAERNIRDLIKPSGDGKKPAKFDPTTAYSGATGAVPEVLGGNWIRSTEHQQYRQAAEQWIRAFLRKESGAAIGKDEFARDFIVYFPQPGDSPETIAQKEAARINAVRGFAGETRGFFEHASPDQAKLVGAWAKGLDDTLHRDADKAAAGKAAPAPQSIERPEPPKGAIDLLRMQPNPKMIEFFEQKYGPGSARRYLERPDG